MSPRNTPRSQRLGEAQEAEAARLEEEERRTRWRRRWNALRASWGRFGRKAKGWAAAAAVASAVGKPIWWVVAKAHALYKAQSIAPAELPKTGIKTVATDFVPEPRPAAQPSGSGERD